MAWPLLENVGYNNFSFTRVQQEALHCGDRPPVFVPGPRIFNRCNIPCADFSMESKSQHYRDNTKVGAQAQLLA